MAELERIERDGIAFWRSPGLRELGFIHAFSTRLGGVSEGVFDSLNLGRSGEHGDDPARVDENLRRFHRAMFGRDALDGGRLPALVRVRQVHGNGVVDAEHDRNGTAEADAIVSADARCAATVRVADCAAILIACPRTGAVAAVHAGWRGVVAGVIEATISRLGERGAAPGDLRAAIGPCIGARAFEVGPEVAAAFEARDLGSRVLARNGDRVASCRGGAARHHGTNDSHDAKPTIDLAGAVADLLERAGVRRHGVDRSDLCTVELERDFFSYRRQGPMSGRMAAAIACRAAGTGAPATASHSSTAP